jgi:LPS O-antigen subunit length determinant protein (WzzB/FepE family)
MDMSQEIRRDEINLLELFKVLTRYKGLLLGLPLVGAILAALLVSFVLRPTWEASAVLEIGHTGSTIAEPIANVITRVMLPTFAKGAINYAGIKSDESEKMQGFYGTLKVNQVKGADLLEFKLRGPSAEMAKTLIQGAIVNLQKTHSEMMAVSIDTNKKQLQIVSEDIKAVSAEIELFNKRLLSSRNWNSFDATLFASVLQNKSNQLRDMVQRKLALEELLTPSRTFTTRVIDEIYVSEGPVSPKKLLIIELALLLGLFVAVVVAFAHNAFATKSA